MSSAETSSRTQTTADILAFRRRGTDTARQFLPAALEILETPASPVGRAVAGSIILFFAVAIVWATFGRVDIIATAPGKIVPTGRTKTIQPLETGIVSAIHVQDGDHVGAGQVLVELDRTVTQAERQHVQKDLIASELDVARLEALRDSFESLDVPRDLVPPTAALTVDVARARLAEHAQAAEQSAKLTSITRQIDAINQDATGLRNVEALQQLGECRFAGARRSDDADHLTCKYLERNVVQH